MRLPFRKRKIVSESQAGPAPPPSPEQWPLQTIPKVPDPSRSQISLMTLEPVPRKQRHGSRMFSFLKGKHQGELPTEKPLLASRSSSEVTNAAQTSDSLRHTTPFTLLHAVRRKSSSIQAGFSTPGESDLPDETEVLYLSQPELSGKRLKLSKSTPALSQRLSTQLFHPTVIHRPALKTRPSLVSFSSRRSSFETDFSPTSPVGTAATSILSDSSSSKSKEENVSRRSSVDGNTISNLLAPKDGLPTIAEVPVLNKPTIATIETTAATKVFFEIYFNKLLTNKITARSQRRRDLESKMRHHGLPTAYTLHMQAEFYRKETEYLRELRALKSATMAASSPFGIIVGGYNIVKVLGKGSFGVVRLVQSKENTLLEAPERALISEKEVFAMKVIKKSEMLRNCQEGHIWAERDFLVASEGSRWIIPLIASFQDLHNLYLVMDFMIGGDFLGLLIRKDRLPENVTKFYIAEMILCIEEAHAMKWIHRDIKPDNFLLSASGHLKISDFGLAFDGHWAHDQDFHTRYRYELLDQFGIEVEGDAKDQEAKHSILGAINFAAVLKNKGKRDDLPKKGVLDARNETDRRVLAASLVGTSQYMAPEVIRSEFYDARCDWWSLGCIMYECLYGRTPFFADDRLETKARIMHHKQTLYFPSRSHVSDDAIRLIQSLLTEPSIRLCSQRYIANEMIRAHIDNTGGATSILDYNHKFRQAGGDFVYANDAADIKAHPFFRDIDWQRIHLQPAPWRPRISSPIDTKYFDEGTEISDFPPETDETDQNPFDNPELFSTAEKLGEWYRNDLVSPSEAEYLETLDNKALMKHEHDKKVAGKKTKKRPRDIILRDTRLGKQAMAIRKKGAFLGYTYKRPKNEVMSG